MSKQETKKEVSPRRPLVELGTWERDVEQMLEDFLTCIYIGINAFNTNEVIAGSCCSDT